MMTRTLYSALVFIAFLAISQLAGIMGALVTRPAISSWYVHLEKPFFTPPNWLFGPVWILLYILMGIAAFLIWQSSASLSLIRAALILFFAQLVFNAAWSFLFFGMRSPLLGLIDIGILLVLVAWTLVAFMRIHVGAGILLIPYFLWLTYATVLNAAILWLNR